MPTNKELQIFYDGFLFGARIKNLKIILNSAPKLFSLLGLPKNGSLKMLDVGGGGGFYAKAFEMSGYGESTYVDLDIEACLFAKEKVGVKNVINEDASSLEHKDTGYDFIMCRHVIEHMVYPTKFILKMAGYLANGGKLLIICPNGESLEYFAYLGSNLKNRIKKISEATHISTVKVLGKLLFGDMLHGIDPPRHLWAISRKGMQQFLLENGFSVDIQTFPLTDPIFSPYHLSKGLFQKASALFGNLVVSKIYGGTHLSTVIRKLP